MINIKDILSKRPIVFILALLSCFLWGSAFPAIKIGNALLGIENAPWFIKMQFAGFRFLLASIMVGGFLVVTRQRLTLTRAEFKTVMILGFLQTCVQNIFFYIGLSNSTGIKGAIMTSAGTFFSILITHFYYSNDKLNRNKMVGLIIGFTGVLYINIAKGSLDSDFKFAGEGLLLIASLISAITVIVAKENTTSIHPVKLSAYQMFFGALMILGISFPFSGGNSIHWTNGSLSVLIYLSFISATAFSLWYSLLKYNKVSHISIFKFAIPIFGTILSAVILPGENLNFRVVISLILTAIGIFLVNKDYYDKRFIPH